jgi:predicted site-specific integrase-resolvase
MLIGYARVSSQDQNLELQIEALIKVGCKKVFEDKISGSRKWVGSVAKLPIAVYVEDEHTRSTLMARDRSKAIP